MELTLVQQTETQIIVTCNTQPSHAFDLHPLLLTDEKSEQTLINDPIAYGQKLYHALFPPASIAYHALTEQPERILLALTTPTLDAIPWEYTYGPYGTNNANDPDYPESFLVLECHFVRGLPADQRIAAPNLENGLHIVAIPSDPLSEVVAPLDIEAEWTRLKEIIEDIPYAITLERTRPPTLERVRQLVANQKQRIVHFMGHGASGQEGALLCFEKENGDLDLVTAKQLIQRVRNSVFLVTLNACLTARPGPTSFSNLAAALVRQKTPYALGMRLSIYDDDARAFSRLFYSELARGSSVEEALLQTRLHLARSSPQWVVGVPVLYTALTEPAPGFTCTDGTPTIKDVQPASEISALPPVEGTFQGRIEEQQRLGSDLTGDSRPRILTIHGGGGQGKTALARKAVERFAHAWPGGVWATSLEILPDRTTFASKLARFLGIATQEILDLKEIERQLLQRLAHRRTLIVLDNVETLIDAVETNDAAALRLVEFIKQLPGPFVSLLLTSRILLGWAGEVSYGLGGLSPEDGAALFLECAPQRASEADPAAARQLSIRLDGHPLGLRLLAGAFNASTISLSTFIATYEQQLIAAEDKYVGPEHRHRKLYACIKTSVRFLNEPLRALLSGLWIFHAPFLPGTAVAIFDPDATETEQQSSPVRDGLYTLWQRGLLVHKIFITREGMMIFYDLLPTTRPYVEHHLEQAYERETLLTRFGAAYTDLANFIYMELDRQTVAFALAQQVKEDVERASAYVTGLEQGSYLRKWGWVTHRLGDPIHGLQLLERALEIAQGADQSLALQVSNDMALVYSDTGRLQEALRLYEQTLPLTREKGDRVGEAITLSNIAGVYSRIGKPQEALNLCEQALLLDKETGNHAGEATTLNTMATVYSNIGKRPEALTLYQRALLLHKEIGDRADEATILNNIATLYGQTGQPQEALALYEQALLLHNEIGDRSGEAVVLNNMAGIYRDTGKPREALKLYEQTLPLMRNVGNRVGEAATLSNMAGVYHHIGKPQEALKLCEQALSLMQEVGVRAGEASVLNNIALVYNHTGKSQEALTLYQQALSLVREVGNRAGEATILTAIAGIYRDTGKPQEALTLFEQALSLRREVGDRSGEAVTLNSIAGVYSDTGKPQEALTLFEQALPLRREVGDRAGEAATLTNIADIYRDTGKPQEALTLYQQALSLMQEVGDRAGEAATLNSMAMAYSHIGKPQEALTLCEQALPLRREVGDRAGEAKTLNNIARVYSHTGKPQEALKLYEQTLPLMQELGDRIGEAATLNNMAGIYSGIGKPQEALTLYQQALSLAREVGDRTGEAATLNNMGMVYNHIGEPQEALTLFEQALSLRREVGDRAGEASTLNNIAMVYSAIGKPQEALTFYQQALPLAREVGDRAGEANTLNNIAIVYRQSDKPQEALKLYESALPLMQEIGNRAGVANTLNNMAAAYSHSGKLQKALTLYQQALPLIRDVGDRAGEATTLYGLGNLYQSLQRYTEALAAFEDSILIAQQASYPAAEIAGLASLAALLYQHFNRSTDAIIYLEQAIALLQATGLPQDAAGHTVEILQLLLTAIRHKGIPKNTEAPSMLPAASIQRIVSNTVAVMTVAQEHHTEWYEHMTKALQDAQQQGAQWPNDVDFFTAVLDILNGRFPTLSPDHPYAQAITAIKQGIADSESESDDPVLLAVQEFINAENREAKRQIVETQLELLFLPDVEMLFEALIKQARAAGEEDIAQFLALHLAILRKCKQSGITETFEHIRQEELVRHSVRQVNFGISRRKLK